VRVQVQAGAQRLAVQWSFGKFSEHAEFNGAEQGLRAHEANGNSRDFVGSKLVRHKFRLREFAEFERRTTLYASNILVAGAGGMPLA
jgi:hypothetical protein